MAVVNISLVQCARGHRREDKGMPEKRSGEKQPCRSTHSKQLRKLNHKLKLICLYRGNEDAFVMGAKQWQAVGKKNKRNMGVRGGNKATGNEESNEFIGN